MLRWNSEKGFGFIKPDDGGADQFAHATGLVDGEGSVREGDRCQYEIGFDERSGKEREIKVEVIDGGGGGGRGRSRSRGRGGGDRGGDHGRRDSRDRGDRRGGGGGRRRDDSRGRG